MNSTLWVVSDNSVLMSMDENGENINTVIVGSPKQYDLEAITAVPFRPDFLYLGLENPASILEWSIEEKKVVRTWNLAKHFQGLPENAGMEALMFVKTNRSAMGGYFVAGIQLDARLRGYFEGCVNWFNVLH